MAQPDDPPEWEEQLSEQLGLGAPCLCLWLPFFSGMDSRFRNCVHGGLAKQNKMKQNKLHPACELTREWAFCIQSHVQGPHTSQTVSAASPGSFSKRWLHSFTVGYTTSLELWGATPQREAALLGPCNPLALEHHQPAVLERVPLKLSRGGRIFNSVGGWTSRPRSRIPSPSFARLGTQSD